MSLMPNHPILTPRILSIQDLQVLCQPVAKHIEEPDLSLSQVVQDSRDIPSRSVFVAIRGTRVDSHDFIAELATRSDILIIGEDAPEAHPEVANYMQVEHTRAVLGPIAQAFAGDPWQYLQVIGITGTNGKTTTATLIYELLHQAGKPVSLLGTVSKRILDQEIPSTLTTSDAIELAQDMKQMVEAGSKYLVMEVSSHALDQYRVHGIPFTVAVFTNITHDHLDYHGSFEAYLDAKKKLFDELKPGSWAIVNSDDPAGNYMVQDTDAQILSLGLNRPAHAGASPSMGSTTHRKELPSWAEHISFTLISHDLDGSQVKEENEQIWHIPLVGIFNTYNTLQALLTVKMLGVSDAELGEGLRGLKGAAGRLERVWSDDLASGIQKPAVFVDYAHTPDALENICSTLSALKQAGQKLTVVFGAGGDRDASKRPKMAQACERYCDAVIVTTDNPRSESPESIIEDIVKGFQDSLALDEVLISESPVDLNSSPTSSTSTKISIIVDRKEAIARAISHAGAHDIVVIAGKGHENYQEVKGVKHPFDDRMIAKDCLNQWKEAA